ncbi:uncharacterized protein [Gossypium hirsutum]|uniref:Gag-Pol polyprotein n=1 Tax=Gossypium hirsutum TaxID=3635 RepID=A0A1U8J1C4_GOSHI|nr:uncharacterized protein LOC107902476 [Gossypium hirsutum]
MSDRPERTEQEEVNSRVQTSKQGTSSNVPISLMREEELKNMIYGFMNQWYNETIQERNQAQQSLSPITTPVVPSVAPPPPSITESSKYLLLEKLRKHGAEKFRGKIDDDPVKAEYWLQSIMRVFKEMVCSSDDYLRCAVSLLKEETYNWWETIEAVVPIEKITWEFFQSEFKKKYVSRRFEERLNDEIKMMIEATEIQEFVVLSDRTQKLEEVYNRKMQQDRKSKESFKRNTSKSFSTLPVKKSREEFSRTISAPERLGKSRPRQSNFRTSDRLVVSEGSVQNTPRPKCQHCGRNHPSEYRGKIGACYKCGVTDHFI